MLLFHFKFHYVLSARILTEIFKEIVKDPSIIFYIILWPFIILLSFFYITYTRRDYSW